MMAALTDEFVLECELIALEKRAELGLESGVRLDPRALAELLAIKIVSIAHYGGALFSEVRRLTKLDVEAFSAATVFCGRRCMIIFNPAHSEECIAISIAHELAHLLLEHEPTWPIFDERTGERTGDPLREAEADYLAEALLVPETAAVPALRKAASIEGAAEHFGVSVALMERRIALGESEQDALVSVDSSFGAGGEPAPRIEQALSASETLIEDEPTIHSAQP